jgi:hypothetical protein
MYSFIRFLVGHIVRIVARLTKERGNDQWPRENGTVYHSTTSDLFPGGLAEIIYSYSHKGLYLSGTHEKRFSSYFEANRYVASFPKGSKIVIRVKPESPKTSIVRDEDQDQAAMKSMARFQ